MTLVAAFRAHGVPALVGDLLVTYGGSKNRHSTRRKLVRLSANFAVAYTGHVLAADLVVKRLQRLLNVSDVNINAVAEVLKDTETAAELGTLQVTLLAWCIDTDGQHCFRWNSAWPHELFFGDPLYDGSGGDVAGALIGQGLTSGSPVDVPKTNMHVVSGLLYCATRLMQSELEKGIDTESGFGYCYEMLRYVEAEGRFDYVDDILYMGLSCAFDAHGKLLERGIIPPFAKYRVVNEFALVDWRFERGEAEVNLTDPVGRFSGEAADRLLRSYIKQRGSVYPFKSSFYCLFVRFNAADFTSPPIAMILEDAEHMRIEGTKFTMSISGEMLENVYRVVRDEESKKSRRGIPAA